MKEGWDTRILKEVTIFKSGKTVSKDIEKTEGDIIYAKVGAMNLKGNETNITTSTRFVDLTDINLNQLIPIGSVIFPKRGGAIATNKKRKITKPTIVDLNTMAIVPSEKLFSQYLYYFIKSIDLNELSNGTSIPQINNGSFDNVYISFPKSLPEQKAIVKILDSAFAKIDQAKANIEKNIENAKELFQSKLNEIFSQRGEGWEERSLKNLINIKHGFAFKSEFFNKEGDYVLLTPGNYYESGGYKDRGKKQKYYVGEIPEGYILKEGDLLLAMTEQAPGLLGSPLIVPHSNRFLHNQRLGLVIIKDDLPLKNEFLFFLFNTKHLRNEVFKSGSGVKVRHTSPTKIGNVKVNVCFDIDLQNQIIQNLKSVNSKKHSLVTLYSNKIVQLDDLKKSLLQKAFAGELV